jgi:hypothetical protein
MNDQVDALGLVGQLLDKVHKAYKPVEINEDKPLDRAWPVVNDAANMGSLSDLGRSIKLL